MNRVKPLAEICPIYDSPESEIPEAVRIPMSDGKVLTYRLDVTDAAQQSCQRALEIIRKWNSQDETVGYRARHAQKESRWTKFLRLMERKKTVSW